MDRCKFCLSNNIPTHFSSELVLHSKVKIWSSFNSTSQVKSYLLLKDLLSAFPESYILPEQKDLFEANRENHDLWACKEEMIDRGPPFWLFPWVHHLGEGVYVFTKDMPIPQYKSDKVVIQSYIENPCLYQSKKWTFRLVVLCTGLRVSTQFLVSFN